MGKTYKKTKDSSNKGYNKDIEKKKRESKKMKKEHKGYDSFSDNEMS